MSPDAARILAAVRRHGEAFDFTDGGLGEELCAAFTAGVAVSITAEQAPDGTPWDDLSATYAEWKGRKFPGKTMGELHGLMADPVQIAGDVIVLSPTAAFVTYGTDEAARAEAAAFQQGDPTRNRPPRPFWGFTKDSKAAVDAILADRHKQAVG